MSLGRVGLRRAGAAAGGGEANTSYNVGTGEGLAKAKVVFDLPFKSLLGTVNEIVLVGNVDDITFSLASVVARLDVAQSWSDTQTFLDTLHLRTTVSGFDYIFTLAPIAATVSSKQYRK